MLFSFIFAYLMFLSPEALGAKVNSMRIGQGIGSVRVVFDVDKEFDYKVFLLSDPKRLVVDTQGIDVNPKIQSTKDSSNFISSTRLGSVGVDGTRIVFDLVKPATIKKVFMLPPQSSFGWRFVIDLTLSSEREFLAKVGNEHAFTNSGSSDPIQAVNKTPSSNKTGNDVVNSKKVIVLDPGHGGRDPGAIGVSGVYEKTITLSMAKELKSQLEREGYKVHLTRSTDIFIPLRDRVKIARKYHADLFISIHADSAKNRRAKGLSVYTLSETASDREAAALAERENKADVIDGLNLAEHSKEVSDILINLAQRESMNRSSEFAGFMVREMRQTVNLISDTHRFANFAVLKAPDIPSILLEMGYLSNATEERLLKQESYRKQLATSTKKAINAYFKSIKYAFGD